MITNITSFPPPIQQSFSTDLLLDFWEKVVKRVYTKIIPLSNRKIRAQDTGKRKQFDAVLKEFIKEHERKKIEKVEYETKTKEAIEKRPRIPNTGGTFRFSRIIREE